MRKDLMFAERMLAGLRPFDEHNKTVLADLFYEGFNDTIDAEYDNRKAYSVEIQAVMDGRYGQFCLLVLISLKLLKGLTV